MHQNNNATLPICQWQKTANQYTQKVKAWTEPYRQQKSSGHKHPVHDFLFSYYSYPMGKLETWHPGLGPRLETTSPKTFNHKYYTHRNGFAFLNPTLIPPSRIPRLRWIQRLLQSTLERPPNFACFGLHEWAMLYKDGDIRHRESAPLRLTQEETNQVIEARTIRCSHYDAYRFFSPSATNLNKLNPTENNRHEYEQPGCLHTNMDLYKWCYKAMPWISSDTLWECFLLAKDTRQLDMRASPYDLSQYQLKPVKIETKQGREEYENLQRELSNRAAPIRKNLINKLDEVLNIAEGIANTIE